MRLLRNIYYSLMILFHGFLGLTVMISAAMVIWPCLKIQKLMKHFSLLVILALLTGCSYIHPIGEIAGKRVYKIQLGSIAGSTQTMFGILDTNTGTITYSTPIGGNGIAGAVASGSGQAAAGWFIGRGLEKGDFSSSTAVSVESVATASPVVNHAPVINIPDPPPAPPITRPTPTRPPFGRPWR